MTPDEAEQRVANILADRETASNLEPDPALRAWLKADAEALSLLMGKGTCSVEGCGRPVRARQLCAGHYEQHRAQKPLTALRTARGEGEQLTVHMPRELRERAQKAAQAAGMTEGEWWRAAGEEKLGREPWMTSTAVTEARCGGCRKSFEIDEVRGVKSCPECGIDWRFAKPTGRFTEKGIVEAWVQLSAEP